jgi:hypothetical protein
MRLQVKVGNQYRIFRDIDPDQFVMYHRQGERTSFSLVAHDNPALVNEPEIATMGAWDAVLSVRGAVHQIGRLRCSLSQHGDSHEFSGVVYSSVTDHRGQDRPPTEEELQRAEAAIERVTAANGRALSETSNREGDVQIYSFSGRTWVEQAIALDTVGQRLLERLRQASDNLGACTATTHTGNGIVAENVNAESILRVMEEAQQRLMNSSGSAIGSYWQGGSPVYMSGYRELRSLQEQESQSTPLTEYTQTPRRQTPKLGRFITNSNGLVAICGGTVLTPCITVRNVRPHNEMFEVTGYSEMFNEVQEGEEIPLYDIHFSRRTLINKGIIKEETYARSIEL